MTIQEFVEKAVEGGWKCCDRDIFPDGKTITDHVVVPAILLDPEAWKAVGKVEGWKQEDYFCTFGSVHPTLASRYAGKAYVMDTWQRYMLSMMESIIDGKTIEQFLETL